MSRVGNNPELLKVMCKGCISGKSINEPWFAYLLQIWELKNAGYPFDRDDLSIEMWKMLRELDVVINNYNVSKQQGK